MVRGPCLLPWRCSSRLLACFAAHVSSPGGVRQDELHAKRLPAYHVISQLRHYLGLWNAIPAMPRFLFASTTDAMHSTLFSFSISSVKLKHPSVISGATNVCL
eukprot:5221529-Amphidinium_carterae.1